MRRTSKASTAGSNSGRGVSSSALALAFALFAVSLAAALALAPAPALAATAHEYESSFGPDCTSSTEFEAAGPVAVDQTSHDIYVAQQETGTVVRCAANGTPAEFTAGTGSGTNEIPGFSFVSEEGLNEIAVNQTSHDFYVTDSGSGAIKAFHQDGEEAEFSATASNEITGFGLLSGIAVDANGAIYASDLGSGEVKVFAPSGAELTSFSAPEACNVAVDSTGTVYVAFYAGGLPVEKFTPSGFPVTATTTYSDAGAVDPNPAVALAVDPSNDDLYVDERFQVAQYEADGTLLGTFAASGPGAPVRSEGVAVDGSSGKVYVSDTREEHKVAIFSPPPPNPPSVESVSATGITATSADLSAQIDPELFQTTYRFEYLSEAEFLANGETFSGAKTTADTDLGSAGTPQGAHAHISALTPDTTYLFRVAAENENNEGAPVFNTQVGKFNTFALLQPGLPDGRAYEMVSPPQKSGEVIPPEPGQNLAGSCRECLPGINNRLMPMQSAPDGNSILYLGQPFSGGLAAGPNQYLANRASGGWGTQSLSAPTTTGAYVAASPDLSREVIFQEQPALSPEAPVNEAGRSYPNLYLHTTGGSFRPLVTETPPNRARFEFSIVYSGANAGTASTQALSHLVFEADDALTEAGPDAPEAPEVGFSECSFAGADCNLYEWVNGQLRLVNVLPENGAAASGAVVGSGRHLTINAGQTEPPNVDHAISADGSRIFWSAEETGQVYVRIKGEKTLEVPGPGSCKESLLLEERACFLTASADGSEVLLSNGEIFALDEEEEEAYEPVADLTEGQGGFQGILGASEETLFRVYFVDTQALTGGEENANEEEAETGEFNLYAWDSGELRYIGTLTGGLEGTDMEFGSSGRFGAAKASRPNRTAQVSVDGSYLAFMSQASLTGYDNTFSGPGKCQNSASSACFEVFEYSAGSERLSCASCSPSGQQPIGLSNLSLLKNRPGFAPFRQPGNLSANGDGRLFFESQDILSPRDTNGHIQDVYEWEPEGTETNGVVTCQRSNGCVFLISSGQGPNDSMFVDSTPSGNDAFFITPDRLLPRDKDDLLDVYDARAPHISGEEVGFPEATVSPCGVEACKGPLSASPQLLGTGSAEFNGPGNPPKQHKKKPKKHHKKKRGKHHKPPAKHNRGGSK